MVEIPKDSDPNEMGKENIKKLINETPSLDLKKIVEIKFGF